jgi:hypothetical protein
MIGAWRPERTRSPSAPPLRRLRSKSRAASQEQLSGLDPPFHKLEAPLTLSLGLNELATNAAKYGALASPTGRVTLMACVEAGENGDEFCLVWQEDGGRAVAPPPVAGFGTSMLSQAIEYQHRRQGRAGLAQAGLDLPPHSANRQGDKPFGFAPGGNARRASCSTSSRRKSGTLHARRRIDLIGGGESKSVSPIATLAPSATVQATLGGGL